MRTRTGADFPLEAPGASERPAGTGTVYPEPAAQNAIWQFPAERASDLGHRDVPGTPSLESDAAAPRRQRLLMSALGLLALVAVGEGVFIAQRSLFNTGAADTSDGSPQSSVLTPALQPPSSDTQQTGLADSPPTPASDTPQTARTGLLRVQADLAGARVVVDGEYRGMTPLDALSLSAGQHVVTVTGAGGSIRHVMAIEPGSTASLLVPRTALRPAAAAGWLVVSVPIAVRVLEDGLPIGTNETARIMLPAGRHDLTFINEQLGYSAAHTIEVRPGEVTSIQLPIGEGRVNVNAQPWAEVWLDGSRLGETPLANVRVPIGSHEFVFRHPELGERRRTVTVSLRDVTRISVDLTQ